MTLITLELDRRYGLELLNAFLTSQPIPVPPSGRWRQLDTLAVAGAFLYAASAFDPARKQPDLNPKQRETVEDEFMEAAGEAARFMAGLFPELLGDGEWPADLDVLRGVYDSETGEVMVDWFPPKPD